MQSVIELPEMSQKLGFELKMIWTRVYATMQSVSGKRIQKQAQACINMSHAYNTIVCPYFAPLHETACTQFSLSNNTIFEGQRCLDLLLEAINTFAYLGKSDFVYKDHEFGTRTDLGHTDT